MSPVSDLQLARLCLRYAGDKLAVDPVILDLREVEGPALFFVICGANSDPQIKAIANGIEKSMKENHDILPYATSGSFSSRWLVMDYSSVLVHIFHNEKRAYYRLEDLWSDAPRIEPEPAA